MQYRIVDHSTETQFNADIYFDMDISTCFESGNFEMTIKDILEKFEVFTVTADDMVDNVYGIIQPSSTVVSSMEQRIQDSLAAHKGLVLVYNRSEKCLTVIMVPKATNGTEEIGFYSSRVYIDIMPEQSEDAVKIDFLAPLFPAIRRNPDVVRYDTSVPDPILGDTDIRPAYDFNIKIDQGIRKRFVYNTKNSFYANTDSKNPDDERIPVFISTLDAYVYGMTQDEFREQSESYLLDTAASKKIPMEYELEGPTAESVEVLPGYNAELNHFTITQFIYTDKPGVSRNQMVFRFKVPSVNDEE